MSSATQDRLMKQKDAAAYLGVDPRTFRRYDDVETMRAQLADVDLEPMVEEWSAAMASSVSEDTRKHCVHHLRSLIPEGVPFPRSSFTSDRIQRWIDVMDAKAATKVGTFHR